MPIAGIASDHPLKQDFDALAKETLRLAEEFKHNRFKMIRRFVRFTRRLDLPTAMVLNGHFQIEDLLNQLLLASISHPEELGEKFYFAERLSILRMISPLRRTSPFWTLILKLNGLRNAVAHRKGQDKFDRLLKDINELVGKARPSEGKDESPESILTGAFAAAIYQLEYLLTVTRHRNQVKQFWIRLESDHPIEQPTVRLIRILNALVEHDIFDPKKERVNPPVTTLEKSI
jgi:hypothetical protein